MKMMKTLPFLYVLWLLCFYGITLMLPAQSLVIYGLQNDNPQNSTQSDFQITQVDPFSGSTSPLYTIPNTDAVLGGGSTYDPTLKRYLFWGVSDNNTYAYYSASTLTNDWTTNGISNFTPSELQYDLQTGTTYGLEWDQTTSTEYLVSINPQTGLPIDSFTLQNVAAKQVWTSGFNSNHHRFFFVGMDFSQKIRFYYIDAQTGQILSQPEIGNSPQYIALQYDLSTNQMIGLESKSNPSNQGPNNLSYRELWLVNVDTLTGLSTPIGSSPLWEGYEWGIQGGFTDYDQLTQTFMFLVADPDSGRRLNLANINSGQLIASTPFPEQIFEIECDNLIFARQAYPDGATSIDNLDALSLEIYPNPTVGEFILKLSEGMAVENIEIFDLKGRSVSFIQKQINAREVQLVLESSTSGIYLVQIQDINGEVFSKKLILE